MPTGPSRRSSGGSLVRELDHGVVGELALAVAPAVSAYVSRALVRFTQTSPGRSPARADRPFGGDRRSRGRGEVELGSSAAPRRARPSAARCTRTNSSSSPGRTIRSRSPEQSTSPRSAGAAHPVRPTELLRRDERPVPMPASSRAASRRSTTSRRRSGWSSEGSASLSCPGPRSPTHFPAACSVRSGLPARPPSGARSWWSNVGPRPEWPFLETLWDLLERIPELIPRALPIMAIDPSRDIESGQATSTDRA